MKKVLFIPSPTLPFPPVKGGAVQNLLNFLVEDNDKKQKLDIYITSVYDILAEKKASSLKNCKVHFIKVPKVLVKIRDKQVKWVSGVCARIIERIYIKGIRNIIRKINLDVIVFENTYKYSKILEKDLQNKYKILHLHNDYLNVDEKNAKVLAESYDEIICISRFIQERVRAVSNVKTDVVYNGIEIERFKRNLESYKNIRSKYNIPNDSIVFLFSGRIVIEKGVLELVKAFNKLNRNDVFLIILGSRIYGKTVNDEYTAKVLEEVEKSNKKIKMIGYINYEEINKYYSACDIGVQPTLCEEALSLSVIEYLSTGMPAIISNSGGMVELVTDSCGFIIDRDNNFIDNLANKMRILAEDKNLLEKYSIEAQSRAMQFNIEHYCNNFWNVMENSSGKYNIRKREENDEI
ncbi:glycosyltransferase family 4 protein [uncultured Clostridium sp.]|jgi:spore coat protein SA|uniref:glycosyltransferase family 4 protein n=1 Tax=uncultured Clostridium sp. TaxID=59620 RepID=UPI0025D6EE79|nr:glycosyltransferase family 4 protein [uncultured Clostridium sp.]